MLFRGAFTALITPFKNNKVDYTKLRQLIRFQIDEGIDGLVVCATTGEAPTLTEEEKIKIIKEAVSLCRNKIPVIAYTGTNSTQKSIEFTRKCASLKVDGALVVVPYYNKPSQEGMYQHFKLVAKSTKLPIILYNVPSRTVASIKPETIARLAKIRNIVGIKEAISDMKEIKKVKKLTRNFTILSGDDELTYDMLKCGAEGVISVTSNIFPTEITLLITLHKNKNKDDAKDLNLYLRGINQALFIESNPVPLKTAMKIMGRLNGEVRLPLVGMLPENVAKLRKVLKKYKI